MEVLVDGETRGIRPLKTTRQLDFTSCGAVNPPSFGWKPEDTQKLQEPRH